MKTIKDIRTEAGLTKAEFSRILEIPYRTVQNWEAGINKCPDYVIKLIEYRLKNEK